MSEPTPTLSTEQRTSNRRVVASGALFALIALAGVLIVLYAWELPPFRSAIETTENAAVRGQVTIVGARLPGTIVEVPVQDFQQVKEGQLLARIDDRVHQARLAQAQAQLALLRTGRNPGRAAVENAEAALRLAEIELSNTRVLAPRDGQLGQVAARPGAYVNAGTQLMALVPPVLWVVANLKETQMAGVRPGQPVSFSVDALDHARLRGHVERIAPATGSEFSLMAPDNASGNFVKVAQRIPVRIRIDPGQALAARLRPGMSVVASIDTSAADGRP